MENIFIYMILITFIMVLIIYIFYINTSIKDVSKSLKRINDEKTLENVYVSLGHKGIEELAKEINKSTERTRICEAKNVSSNARINEMITSISHDLRTPMTSILGFVQLIKKGDFKEDYIDIIEERATTLQILINEFYSLSLSNNNNSSSSFKKTNLTKILKEALLGFYNIVESKGLDLEIFISNEECFVLSDENTLYRILENLLSNICKYSKDKASISLISDEKEITMKLINNLVDVNTLNADKIFDMFYRADKSRNTQGSGLGLAITKNLVELMDGSIGAEVIKEELVISVTFKKNI